MAIGESVKAPLYALGADGDYHKIYTENVAEQVVGLGRRPNTAYAAGDVVSCSTNNQLNLVCTTAGTTATTDLDISSNNVGDTITDGTVVWSCFSRMQAGVPIGFEYFSTNPNIPAGSLPLFGGEYSRTTYKDLWEWVQSQNGYLLEESEWQTKSAENDGNVPFYSKGNGSTTFRVPSLKCWVKGANGIEEVGSYLSAGLPNITGKVNQSIVFKTAKYTGAFVNSSTPVISSIEGGSSANLAWSAIDFDASKSNAIYGNSDTVQPKSIVGMWLVKAYGTVTNVGSTDVSAIAQGLTEAETRISAIEDNKVDKAGNAWVVETYNDGTNWYRKWSDGWLEQGGRTTSSTMTQTFLTPFADTNYAICALPIGIQRLSTEEGTRKTTSTTFVYETTSSSPTYDTSWYACGMGA